MLHIFTGAPVVKHGDDDVDDGKTSAYVWKTYKYDRRDLNQNSGSSNSTASLDIHFEYNDAPLSNLQDDGVQEEDSIADQGTDTENNMHTNSASAKSDLTNQNKEIVEYHDEDIESLHLRTTTDDLYREIYIESQCLLLNSEKYVSNVLPNSQKYHGCKNYKSDFDSELASDVVPSSLKSKSKIIKHLKPYWRHKVPSGDHNKDVTDNNVANCSKDASNKVIDTILETPPELTDEKQTNLCSCAQSNLSSTDDDRYSCNMSNVILDYQNVCKVSPISSAIQCVQRSNLLVVVLQTFPLKKVLVKQGINIGQFTEVASIMVGDETMFYFDITLWKDCAVWVERLCAGDVLLLTDISFQLFRNKTVGRTTKNSRLYNFHHPQVPYPENWKSIICLKKLQSFSAWIQKTHNYLNSSFVQRTASIIKQFTRLTCEHLNDIEAKLINISIHEGQSDQYCFFGAKLPKVTIELQDECCMSRNLFLWGNQYKHIEEMKKSINKMLHISNVIQKFDKNTNIFSLHTTQKSDIKYVNGENKGILDYLCTINYFQFERDSQEKVYLSSTNIQEFNDMSGLLYTACNICLTPLYKDSNNVFSRCPTCEGDKVDNCFLMFIMNIKKVDDKSYDNTNTAVCNSRSGVFGGVPNSLDVIVYPEKASKVFPNFTQSKINTNVDFLQVLRDEIESLLCGKMFTFSLKNIETNADSLSFVGDKFVMIDMVPT